VKPLGARLWLRLPAAPERIGSIWLPPQAEAGYTICQAEVLERGDGVSDWRLQPGAHVIVRLFGATTLAEGKVVLEQDVLALLDLGLQRARTSPNGGRPKQARLR